MFSCFGVGKDVVKLEISFHLHTLWFISRISISTVPFLFKIRENGYFHGCVKKKFSSSVPWEKRPPVLCLGHGDKYKEGGGVMSPVKTMQQTVGTRPLLQGQNRLHCWKVHCIRKLPVCQGNPWKQSILQRLGEECRAPGSFCMDPPPSCIFSRWPREQLASWLPKRFYLTMLLGKGKPYLVQ